MNSMKKKRLGRGLGSLIGNINEVTAPAADGRVEGLVEIDIDRIQRGKYQPRQNFDQQSLQELADSIASQGIVQPVVLRPEGNHYELVAGERRWRAAQLAQLHEVPVLIRQFDDIEVLEVAIIENIQRADLDPIEEAAGYRQLMYKFGHTQEKVAEALGKSRSHIANLLRLLNLPEAVQHMVSDGRLSAGHARTLITAPDPEALAKLIISKGLSVRQAEKLAKQAQNPMGTRKRPSGAFEVDKDADTKALEGDLSAATGMKIRIDHKPGQEAGRLSINYETLEQLDALCALLSTTSIKT
ncbi:MAG: ParB/RepB/Spo0J family partition protein [Paracoccaceae bacterium]|nr:ParB/RepB/Spo0J family partition protein [Paracoccaceae bacterium]